MAGSNGTRMAGEELSKADRHARARERIGNDPERLAERLSGIDREAYDFDGYTDKEINMAMQGGTFDENDYARLTGKPLDDGGGSDKPDNTSPGEPDPTPDPTPTPTPSPVPEEDDPIITIPTPVGGSPYGGMTQTVVQDNDINSTVTGNNNTVTNTQDNSVRQYGGAGSWSNAWMKDYFS